MVNGDGHHSRHSLPHQFSIGGSLLQDIAYSAQQALNQRPDGETMPIDPALQGYANDEYSSSNMARNYPPMSDMIMSSVEQHGNSEPMDGVENSGINGQQQGPSIEPLTPGPPAYHDRGQHRNSHRHMNGYMPYPPTQRDAVRPVSSPVSPRHVQATSPTSPTTHDHNMFTTGSDFIPLHAHRTCAPRALEPQVQCAAQPHAQVHAQQPAPRQQRRHQARAGPQHGHVARHGPQPRLHRPQPRPGQPRPHQAAAGRGARLAPSQPRRDEHRVPRPCPGAGYAVPRAGGRVRLAHCTGHAL